MGAEGTPLPPAVDEQALATALAHTTNAVVITDAAGTIVWVNAAFTRLSGYTPEGAVGATPRLLKSGVQDEGFYADLWSTILSGRPWSGDVVNRHRSGHLYTVRQTITPLTGPRGEVTGFVAIHEDVSTLRSSQARLQALFGHALDAMVFFDDAGRCVDANPAACALTGYRLEELTAMTLREVLVGHAWDVAWARLQTERAAEGVMQVRRSDGTLAEVEVRAVGDVLAGVHVAVARDLTAQRRAELQRDFQAQVLEAVGEAVVVTDLDGTVRYWNPAAERLYGWPAEEVYGRSGVDAGILPDGGGHARESMTRLRAGETWTGELEARRRDGTPLPVLVTDSPYVDPGGGVAGVIRTSVDISALKAAQEAAGVRAVHQAATAALGRFALGADDLATLGAEAERIVAEALEPHGCDVQVVWAGRGAELTDGEAGGLRVDIGRFGALLVRCRAGERLGPQEDEFLHGIANVLQAAGQQHTARVQLEHNATHDPVTGLPNRTLLLDRVHHVRAAAERTGQRFAMLFLDLDSFKVVNDALGHDAGDQLLRLVAGRLRDLVRSADTVARFGGDEFAVLCPETDDEETAKEIAVRIQEALHAPFDLDGAEPSVTVSVGIVIGDAQADARTLLRDADAAMYAAKESGRNRLELFDPRLHHHARQRLDIAAGLRDAIDGAGIVVHYQPTVALDTGEIVGAEALVRWRRPDGELVPPDRFIAVAEETGLIDLLGERVLEEACHAARQWLRADDRSFQLSVNVAPRQLADGRLHASIRRILGASDLPAEGLLLEITESALMSEPAVRSTMAELRELGVRFAIDDFGTGYSSLSYLRHLPVDVLKIDRSFVSGLAGSLQDRSLVAAAVELAHNFGLRATAEGVETDRQREELSLLGCDLAQGHLWSEAVPAARLARLVAGQGSGSRPL